MITDSIKIELVSKLNPSVFAAINATILGTPSPRLGATHSAVKRMIVEKEHMLKMLMPSILGTSTQDVSWYKKVNDYWNSFSLNVPIGGVTFEIGFIYDIKDQDRKSYIKELIDSTSKEGKPTITNDAELKAYVIDKVPELERYLYARPINVVDYLNWVYTLGHSKVANKTTDLTKSVNIDFTLIDQRDIIEIKRASHVATDKALRSYLEVIADRTKVANMIYVMGDNPAAMSEVDCDIKLKHKAETNPTEFIALTEDKALLTKARIERYIIAGVLKRIPSTSIIVDASDTTCILGNTLDETVVYFISEDKARQAKVSELQAKYKSLKQK